MLVGFTQTNGRKLWVNPLQVASVSENAKLSNTTDIRTTATDACWYVGGHVDSVARALTKDMDD